MSMSYVAKFNNEDVWYSEGICQSQNHLSVQLAAHFHHSVDASTFSLNFLLSLTKHSYGFCSAVRPVGVELQVHSNGHWALVLGCTVEVRVFASHIQHVFVRPDVYSVVILLHFWLQWFDIVKAFACRQLANAGLTVEEDLHLGRCKWWTWTWHNGKQTCEHIVRISQ